MTLERVRLGTDFERTELDWAGTYKVKPLASLNLKFQLLIISLIAHIIIGVNCHRDLNERIIADGLQQIP